MDVEVGINMHSIRCDRSYQYIAVNSAGGMRISQIQYKYRRTHGVWLQMGIVDVKQE
jgi:hypothetical protein